MTAIFLTSGLFGSILMFAGDMLLYFTRGPYAMDGTLKPYMHIMKDLPLRRVSIGGALGPAAAFFYVAGFAALPSFATGPASWVVWIAAALLGFALICGGAYHAQYVYLALIAKTGHDDLYESVAHNIMTISRMALVPMYMAFVLLGVCILFGQTTFPAWFVLLTPVITSFLGFLWLHLPQPARCVLFGGWNNLVFIVMFAAMLGWSIAS